MSLAALKQTIQRFGILVSFLILCLVLSLLSDRFLTTGNLVNILRQAAITGTIAVGMTMVILTGGIDLSVGSVLALTRVITAGFLQQGMSPVLVVVVALGLGLLLGLFNGILITRLHIPAFIATLGTLTLVRGLALTYTEGRPITGLSDAFRFIGRGTIGPIPMPIVIAGVTFLAGYILLTRTRVGEYIFALGTNKAAAHLTGISVQRYETLVYGLAGMLAALAGLILTCLLYTSDAADERSSVDLGGRRIINKQNHHRAPQPGS